MKYNIWYKTLVGIWVNGAEASTPEQADLIGKGYEAEGFSIKIIPEGNPAPYQSVPITL